MDRLVARTGDPYADQAVGDIAAHAASVVVDHDRELRVPFPGGMERITVVVAAEHQVDPGLVEHRHEEFVQVNAPVPGPGRRRDMEQDDARRSREELLRAHGLFQPRALLGAVGVVIGQPVVLRMVVGLVLAAVEQQDTDVAVAINAVEPPVPPGKIIPEAVGEDAARLVVAAGEENRRPGSEKRGRSVEVVLEKLLPALDAARHVAVESHESQFGKVHAFAEPGQDVGLAVDVVQHEERASGTRSRKGAEPVGPAPRRIGADSLSIGDVVDVGPRLNLLRKDPVTVVGPGLQPPDTNGVQRPAGQLAAGDGLVMARRRCGRKAVGGRRLDPRKRGPVGGPDHRHSVLRHVAQVRPVRNSEFLCGGRQCEGQSRKHEKQFLHPISG